MDHYEVLGIAEDATDTEVKTAWRKAALRHHPDSVGSDGDTEAFRRVTEAWKELGDAERRRRYDLSRREARKAEEVRKSRFHKEGMRKGSSHKAAPAPRILHAQATAILAAVYAGSATTRVKVEGLDECGACSRTGEHVVMAVCPMCSGRGILPFGGNGFSCPRCDGRGTVVEARNCKECCGNGYRLVNEQINVRLPPGVSDGSIVSIRSASGHRVEITVTIRMTGPWRFEEGALCITRRFSASRLRKGTTCVVTLPDDRKVRLKVPPNTVPGTYLRLSRMGMPEPEGKRGAALVLVALADS